MKICIFLALVLATNLCAGQPRESTLPLIPAPSLLKVTKGAFELTPKTLLVLLDPRLRSNAEVFDEFLQSEFGFTLQISTDRTSVGIILDLSSLEHDNLSGEGYRMSVTEDRVTITGGDAGVFYGLQTLKQLLPVARSRSLHIPGVEIEDAPRYSWRGMHLDVCRHFFPKEFVKKYIDEIAMYKMNTFHWHLTEDQGWRIEIKKYPKLTEIGAWRNGSMVGPYSDQKFDSVRYGGFYTQEDVREIVAYAAKRHVTIVPRLRCPDIRRLRSHRIHGSPAPEVRLRLEKAGECTTMSTAQRMQHFSFWKTCSRKCAIYSRGNIFISAAMSARRNAGKRVLTVRRS